LSSERQADEGVSLDAQRERLRAYALAADMKLVAIHEDAGASAKTLARPGLQAALGDQEGGRDRVPSATWARHADGRRKGRAGPARRRAAKRFSGDVVLAAGVIGDRQRRVG
jgi:hypothetical protein